MPQAHKKKVTNKKESLESKPAKDSKKEESYSPTWDGFPQKFDLLEAKIDASNKTLASVEGLKSLGLDIPDEILLFVPRATRGIKAIEEIGGINAVNSANIDEVLSAFSGRRGKPALSEAEKREKLFSKEAKKLREKAEDAQWECDVFRNFSELPPEKARGISLSIYAESREEFNERLNSYRESTGEVPYFRTHWLKTESAKRGLETFQGYWKG